MSLILMPLLLAGTAAVVKTEPPPTITGDTEQAQPWSDSVVVEDPTAFLYWPQAPVSRLEHPPQLLTHHSPGTRQRQRRRLERRTGRQVRR